MDFSLAAILDQPKKYMSGNATSQALRLILFFEIEFGRTLASVGYEESRFTQKRVSQ